MPGDRRRSRYRRGLAGAFMDRLGRLQVLVDNAGTLFPTRHTTIDGYEEVITRFVRCRRSAAPLAHQREANGPFCGFGT
jgi:hypothetical protein